MEQSYIMLYLRKLTNLENFKILFYIVSRILGFITHKDIIAHHLIKIGYSAFKRVLVSFIFFSFCDLIHSGELTSRSI